MRTTIFAAALALAVAPALAQENPLTDAGSWPEIRADLIGETVPAEGTGILSVEAPYRANDAATVPVVIRGATDGPAIESAMVVIDENPAPMAAEFRFGPAMQPLEMEIRVRVNQYSNVRVIGRTAEGAVMDGRYVKASGGCSAPATKDAAVALSTMGQMKLRQFGQAASGTMREAQIMVRHPNYSGLQRDQITQLFVPAHFIDRLEVWQGEEMLFMMEGGISVSENPVFRFRYLDNGAEAFRVRAHDTEGNLFEQVLPKSAES